MFPSSLVIEPIFSLISPEGKIERAFTLLERKMRQALKTDLDPAIYVMSADCGTGKTKTVQNVLREWKAEGFPGDGAMVMVFTRAEIDAIVAGAGLDRNDYAVFTSDDKYRTYGAGRDAANHVPVLFATHSMVDRLTAKTGSFHAVTEFHRNGRVRSLRVWDEGFKAAEGVAFDPDDLLALPSAYKRLPAADRDVLRKLGRECLEPVAGLRLDIPNSIVDIGDQILKKGLKVAEGPKRTLEALVKLAGSHAYLTGNDKAGWNFIGAGRPMPADIAPLFILDASARLTARYRQLSAYGMKVVELEPATLSYDNVNIHWYDRGAGQTALNDPAQRGVIYKAIADLTNAKPTEQFLLVISKRACGGGDDWPAALPKELHGMVSDPNRVKVATWGRHIGTNEFRDIPNVIIVSSYNYGSNAYDALALAATGCRADEIGRDARREQEAEAFMHNVYQAVCRSSVRLRRGASSGFAHVYLIMEDSDRRRAQITQAFPGASVESWVPHPPIKESKHDLVLRVLSSILQTQSFVGFNELREACGSKDKTYLHKTLRSDRFKSAIAIRGIEKGAKQFYISDRSRLAA